jgi:hypothetical protein
MATRDLGHPLAPPTGRNQSGSYGRTSSANQKS